MRTAKAAILTVVLLLTAGGLCYPAVGHFFSNPFLLDSCSWSGQQQLKAAGEIVRKHVNDATSFTVQTYDCEEGNDAFLAFTSASAPSVVRSLVLREPACRKVSVADEPDTLSVECESGSKHLQLFLSPGKRQGTNGELYIRQDE